VRLLDVDAITEVDDAIAAHWLWLRGEGIPTPGYDDDDESGARARPEPPKELLARLGPIEAMLALEQARASIKGRHAALVGVVLHSLCRLSRFRISSVGLEQVREDFERRRAEGNGLARGEGVDLSLDATHLAVVEKNLAEFAQRSAWVHDSLKRFRVALAKRARGYRRSGFHPDLHGLARAMFFSKWIEGRVVDLLLDIERFREETRGRGSSEPFDYWETPDAKTLRRVQAECRRLVQDSGASSTLILKLFPWAELEQPERRERPEQRSRDRIVKPTRRRKSA
jgi:hypothetical protein